MFAYQSATVCVTATRKIAEEGPVHVVNIRVFGVLRSRIARGNPPPSHVAEASCIHYGFCRCSEKDWNSSDRRRYRGRRCRKEVATDFGSIAAQNEQPTTNWLSVRSVRKQFVRVGPEICIVAVNKATPTHPLSCLSLSKAVCSREKAGGLST